MFPESKPVSSTSVTRQQVLRLEGVLLGGFCHRGLVDEVQSELTQRQILASPLRVLEDFSSYGGVTGYRKWLKRR